MILLRILIILLAGAAVAGQYLQERYMLVVLEKLPGREARDRYEARRRRGERGMLVLTVLCALLGLVALADLLLQ